MNKSILNRNLHINKSEKLKKKKQNFIFKTSEKLSS
jgi:hypothetical protein